MSRAILKQCSACRQWFNCPWLVCESGPLVRLALCVMDVCPCKLCEFAVASPIAAGLLFFFLFLSPYPLLSVQASLYWAPTKEGRLWAWLSISVTDWSLKPLLTHTRIMHRDIQPTYNSALTHLDKRPADTHGCELHWCRETVPFPRLRLCSALVFQPSAASRQRIHLSSQSRTRLVVGLHLWDDCLRHGRFSSPHVRCFKSW